MPLDLIIIFEDPAVDYSWEKTHMEMTLRGVTVEPEKTKPFIIGCHHLRFGECAARPSLYQVLAKQRRLLMNPLMPCTQLPVVQTAVVYQNVTVGKAAAGCTN